MASNFKYRGGWRAQAFDRTGQRLTRDFNRQSDARQWAAEVEAADLAAHAPELGGPTQATLADMLAHYARLYTIRKGGCTQELNRINQYLAAAGRPLLRLRKAAEGAKDIVEISQAEVDASVSAFLRKHLDTRREGNARTHQRIAELAELRVSRITRADIDRLMALQLGDEFPKRLRVMPAGFKEGLQLRACLGEVGTLRCHLVASAPFPAACA